MIQFLEVLKRSMIDDVDNWKQDRHCLLHDASGLKIWTANSFLYFDTYPESKAFSFRDKIEFFFFKRKWNALKLIRTLNKGNEHDQFRKKIQI